MKTTEHCSGCRNNFYNGNNGLGVKKCWSLESAKMVTKFELHRDTPMNLRERYFKTKVPSCYHKQGFVYLDQIPSYAQTPAQRAKEATVLVGQHGDGAAGDGRTTNES